MTNLELLSNLKKKNFLLSIVPNSVIVSLYDCKFEIGDESNNNLH